MEAADDLDKDLVLACVVDYGVNLPIKPHERLLVFAGLHDLYPVANHCEFFAGNAFGRQSSGELEQKTANLEYLLELLKTDVFHKRADAGDDSHQTINLEP